MNILHINDLHITNPINGEKEALRKAYYPEYFETLFPLIEGCIETIDLIIISGDIVNQYEKNNYPYAVDVVLYLAEILSVEENKIYVVNGNHDICRDTGDTECFTKFKERFEIGKTVIESGDRFTFYQESNSGILCLDSIADEFKSGHPSSLSGHDKDRLVEIVRNNDYENIFVISHHTPESYDVQNQAPFDEDNSGWSKKHVWTDGGNLHRRLASKVNKTGDVFWFAGDIHRPEHCVINDNRVLVITGSLNAFEDSSSSILPQVRVISTDCNDQSDLFEYHFIGHNRKGLEGHWEHKKCRAQHHATNRPVGVTDKTSIASSKDAPKENINNDISNDQDRPLTLIDSELEERIHMQVVEDGLYEFGRFDTSPKVTSLSWISIHNLLDSYSTFQRITNEFKRKVNSFISVGISKKDCLLVGLDSWGSILASRLGASTDIRSCCVAVRSQSDSYDSVERVNENLKKVVKVKKVVFVISDVIATGTSISTIREELDCEGYITWYNLTIFCDPSQVRADCFKGYEETFYICGSIRMPIIESSKLPDTDVLRANISFIKS